MNVITNIFYKDQDERCKRGSHNFKNIGPGYVGMSPMQNVDRFACTNPKCRKMMGENSYLIESRHVLEESLFCKN